MCDYAHQALRSNPRFLVELDVERALAAIDGFDTDFCAALFNAENLEACERRRALDRSGLRARPGFGAFSEVDASAIRL